MLHAVRPSWYISFVATKRRWTDEQLAQAVAKASTYALVMAQLGLRPRGGNHRRVKQRIEELALDTSHFTGFRGAIGRPWSDEELREAVRAARCFRDVLTALGIVHDEAMEKKVRRRIRLLRLDASHLRSQRGRPRRRPRWSDDELRRAVAASRSIAGTLRQLGLVPLGGNYDQVKRRIAELELDVTHFTGKGWNRGATARPRPARSLDEVLVADRWTSSTGLKQRLIREGLKQPMCELCGWSQPRSCDGRIPVELDHVNGDKTDNRLANLRILCPNCHALQPTHRGLNKRTRRLRG